MSIWSKLIGGGITQPLEVIERIIDNVHTSTDEKLDKQALLEKLRQQPGMVQAEINKLEAQHRSVFVAGWRPFIGWVCGAGLMFPFILNPIIQWATGQPGPVLPMDDLTALVYALLGLGLLRTGEKVVGRAK